MDLEADLTGIASLLRTHLEIRNRSYLKNIYRDCFIGSDAIDFLVIQGLVNTREEGIIICTKMITKKLIKHISDSNVFKDGYSYYMFMEDNNDSALLANCNAGNGHGIHYGQGGCKWSFAPHTAHNSYVLDIALAEEIERAVAGASVEARALAISKLRQRVREQASADAPDWNLVNSNEVNGVNVCVYNRLRPRGDLQNTKMTGKIAESPRECIRGIMNFERRRQWERMFEDGVVVEPIDIGERYPAPIFDEDTNTNGNDGNTQNLDHEDLLAGIPYAPAPTGHAPKFLNLPDNAAPQTPQPAFARKTDDVFTFLQTVDLNGIPRDMAIAFLNDPERQHALSHLRKQMLESNPEDCALCRSQFNNSAEYRFCPCCASICCATCMSKRVFEVVSRQVVTVCVHCYRESSRIRQPPDVVKDESHVEEGVRGKWWRPEDLGIPDYSDGLKSLSSPNNNDNNDSNNNNNNNNNPDQESHEDDPDRLTVDLNRKHISPFVRSLLTDKDDDHLNQAYSQSHEPSSLHNNIEGMDTAGEMFDDTIDDLGEDFNVSCYLETTEDNTDESRTPINQSLLINENQQQKDTSYSSLSTNQKQSSSSTLSQQQQSQQSQLQSQLQQTNGTGVPSNEPIRTARCKKCGEVISRNVEEIERHMEECTGLLREREGGGVRTNSRNEKPEGPSKILGGIQRKSELEKYATRIIYHTARTHSKLFRPREVCALQDCFVDRDGVWYSYEVSVRHCDVQGISGYTTAEVLLLLHAARPIPGNKDFCDITIVSQVDSRTKAPKWLLSLTEEGGGLITAPRKMDLVRELKASGNLKDILNKKTSDGADEDAKVSLNDFELLAVLGRGGFGKVMQVRHKMTNKIYAMKILKKSELQRRRQVERTKTERTILAAIQHPFIVCLHYAFQNSQKLYMVMDFVQGGDFFTLMRKYRRLPEDWVRVYVTEVAMALQHLHDMDIVYRDLKPENILLCADGHLKLTDFGLSRYFETRPPAPEDMVGGEDAITRSFCGTEQYMSPEMLLQQGHNWRMDWWCLGLLMHEMISARHPFHGPSHYDTLRNMVTKQPVIDARVSSHAATVIRGLLIKNPRARLCCRTGLEELKALPFFSTVDWNGTYNKTIAVPYVPQLNDVTDTSLFETTFTREAPIDSVAENPKQKKRKGGGILGIFGFNMQGKSSTKKQDNLGDAPFAGFSFAKEDEES